MRGRVVKETEAGFTTAVVGLAKLYGWLCFHPLPLRTARGWATGTQGDIGYPDLTCVRGGRLVVAELKVKTAVRPEQAVWLDRFRSVPGAEVFVWKPADWPAIVATLKGEG